MSQNEHHEKVNSLLAQAAVSVSVHYRGQTTREGNWQVDAWLFTVTNARGTRETFDYFTGLGLRTPAAPRMGLKLKPGTVAWQDAENAREPVAPHACDLLHAVLLDSSACGMSFAEWCSDYCYDTDSRKALKTYLDCQEGGEKLGRLFTRGQLETLRDVTQDY